MTLTDKLALLHGYGGGYVGDVPAMAKYGLPPINLEDGPQGAAFVPFMLLFTKIYR